MSRIRSPAYPDVSLPKALEVVAKLHEAIRSNAVDRDAAVRDMGYSGMTGASGKMLANLLHFGLVEKASKGTVRVTPLAVDILHPPHGADTTAALHRAGFSPAVFQRFRRDFPDGVPSANALRSYMIRAAFNDVAIEPATASYLETCAFLQKENAYESHGAQLPPPVDSDEIEDLDGAEDMEAATDEPRKSAPLPVKDGVRAGLGVAAPSVAPPSTESEWLRISLSTSTNIRLMVKGDMGPKEIGKLITLLQAQKAVLEDD